MSDIDELLRQAEAILAQHNITNIVTPVKETKKVPSVKRKKSPTIKSGAHYRYDPATYKENHKVDNWYYIDDPVEIKKLGASLYQRAIAGELKYLSVDTETKPLVEYSAMTIPEHIIRKYVKKNANDVPFLLCLSDGIDAWTVPTNFEAFKDVLEYDVPKLLANAKYDMHMLENIGIKLGGKKRDVQILIKLINENLTSYRLKDLAVRFISKEANKWEIMKDNWMAENRTKDWTLVPKELIGDYGCGDVWYNVVLYEKFIDNLEEYDLVDLFERECYLLDVAYRMERIGFRVNREYLQTLKDEFTLEISLMQQEIYTMAGKVFNVNSGKQLLDFFLSKGLSKDDIKWNTETGNPVFDKDEMKRLAKKFDVVNRIQELKKTEKLLSSYVVNILNTLPRHDRVHGSINTMEAVTGRMSITDPALQTLPKKDKRIRRAFVPKPGHALMFYDLDQIEYRLFAHYCQDTNLIAAIARGWDVHKATAAIIFRKDYDDVTEDERSAGKTDNFALVYGVGNDHLADMLDITPAEARNIKADYFKALPKAKTFLNTVQDAIAKKGYVRNFYKRRRRLTKDEAYKAPNALIQGCAADFIKVAMVKVYEALKPYRAEMINVVHDELIFEVPFDEIDIVAPIIKAAIDDATTFRVPITCGCEWSMITWGDKMDYDLNLSFEENKKLFVEKYPQAV